jgi:hypothetical protein
VTQPAVLHPPLKRGKEKSRGLILDLGPHHARDEPRPAVLESPKGPKNKFTARPFYSWSEIVELDSKGGAGQYFATVTAIYIRRYHWSVRKGKTIL